MNKWEHREKKLAKKQKKTFLNYKEIPHKDKLIRREIKQARREKESVWDNIELEGDE